MLTGQGKFILERVRRPVISAGLTVAGALHGRQYAQSTRNDRSVAAISRRADGPGDDGEVRDFDVSEDASTEIVVLA